MKNLLLIAFCLLLIIACKPSTTNKTVVQVTEEINISQEEIEVIEEISQEQLEGMSILDIIDLYINKKKMILIGDYNQRKDIGYFEFISHNEIKWHRDSGGFEYIPHLNIIDDSTINIEILYFNVGYSSYPNIGTDISACKYYIVIRKIDLIDRYLGAIISVNDYKITKSFFVNQYDSKNLQFKILTDTDIYIDKSLQDEKIAKIKKNTSVEIINMFLNNSNDIYPISVQIKTENLTGWINVSNVDFIKKEQNDIANGVFLHNPVRETINEYGSIGVNGNIIGRSVEIRSSPSVTSKILRHVQEKTLVQILEVSSNMDVINGIESAWYKVFFVLGHNTDEYLPNEYEITGWVFGNNLDIYRTVDRNRFITR